MSAQTPLAAVVAPALVRLLAGPAAVGPAVQHLALGIVRAGPPGPTAGPCAQLSAALARRPDLHPAVAAALLENAPLDSTLATLACNAALAGPVRAAAVAAIISARLLVTLAEDCDAPEVLVALAARSATPVGVGAVPPARRSGAALAVALGGEDRGRIRAKLLENPALPPADALAAVGVELGHAGGDDLARALPETAARPAAASALGWLRAHPASAADLAANPGAHPAVLLAAAAHDQRLAVVMLTGVLLPGLDQRSLTGQDDSTLYRRAQGAATALVAGLDDLTRGALAAGRCDWDTYAGGVLVPLLFPAQTLDEAGVDALLVAGPVADVLAFAAGHRTFQDALPSCGGLRAFLARPDVDAATAAHLAEVFDHHCHPVLDARPADVAYQAAVYARVPQRLDAVLDVDVILAAARVMAAGGSRGIEELERLPAVVLERLGARVLELDWAAATPLLGRDPGVDGAVDALLATLLAGPARAELFRALGPGHQGPLAELTGAFEAALAGPTR